jgi:hypothetical protein
LLRLVEHYVTAAADPEAAAASAAAGPDALAPTVFDPAVLGVLEADLGRDGVADLLRLFRDDMHHRISAIRACDPGDAGAGTALEQQAHAAISLAGNAGCQDLSAAARALVTVCRRSGDPEVEETLSAFLAAADRAIEAMDRHLAETAVAGAGTLS